MKNILLAIAGVLALAFSACTAIPVANSASPDGPYHYPSLFGDLVFDAYGNFKQQCPNGRYFSAITI
jgi:hypothetical protein